MRGYGGGGRIEGEVGWRAEHLHLLSPVVRSVVTTSIKRYFRNDVRVCVCGVVWVGVVVLVGPFFRQSRSGVQRPG